MATQIIEDHRSPDGLLGFLVSRDLDGDIALGFDGFPWHTHADILASRSELSGSEPVRQFVDDLLNGRSIIGIARVGDTLRDVWVTDGPFPDKYKPEDETVEFRYWDGTQAL
jgi:hypothetical protein